MYEHFSHSASLTSYPHPKLHGHTAAPPQTREVSQWQTVEKFLVLCDGKWRPRSQTSADVACLQWCTLLCPGTASAVWGDAMPYEKGRAGLNRKKMFFQAISLRRHCLHSEVTLSRLVSDTVSAVPHHVGIEHTNAQTSLLSTPLRCWLQLCTSSSKDEGEKWGATGSDWDLVEPSLYGHWGCSLVNSCLCLGMGGRGTRNRAKTHLKL